MGFRHSSNQLLAHLRVAIQDVSVPYIVLASITSVSPFFYVRGSDSGNILLLPSVCWFVSLLDNFNVGHISFEPFQIEPSYLACRFRVTRAVNSYKNFDLSP